MRLSEEFLDLGLSIVLVLMVALGLFLILSLVGLCAAFIIPIKFLKWFLMRIFPWVGLPIVSYLLIRYYLPLQNTLFFSFPEPAKVSRPLPIYNRNDFGAPILVGFAKREITPPRFSWLAGYKPPHPAVFIHDRLWVKSLALRDEQGETVVLVSCDLIGFLPDETEKIFALVKNVDRRSIFLSFTHTHSGPDVMGLWGIPPFSGKNEKYLKFLRGQIAAAVDESAANLDEGAIRFGEGELPNNSHGQPENAGDPAVSVMQVMLFSGIPVTLVNFAVHADVVKSLYVTADFPHYLAERLKLLIGGETMFLPGAIGGVQPLNYNDEDFQLARTLGENLADTAFWSLKNPIVPTTASISFEKLWVRTPLENTRFLKAAKLGMISDVRGKDGLVAGEVNKIKIGPAEILTVPGELFPKIWRRVKPKMKGNPKFLFGLTNEEFGYIILPEDFTPEKNPYHIKVSVGPKFGEEIDKALQRLAISD